MYHNQDNMIELHDDVVGVRHAKLHAVKGKPVELHVKYVLRPDRSYNTDPEADVRLHSTNGVNHRYHPLNHVDPLLEDYFDGEQDASEHAVLDGDNMKVVHDQAGQPFVAEGLVEPEPRENALRYSSLDYNPDALGEMPAEERAVREQQDLVDRTTAEKRASGAPKDAPANSVRREDRKEDRKGNDEAKDEKKDK